MKFLLTGFALLIGMSGPVWGQGSIDAITFPNNSGFGPGGYVVGGVGWSFVPSIDIRLTEVGATMAGGALSIQLWESTNNVVGSFVITPQLPHNFGNIPEYTSVTPVMLLAGVVYSISAQQNDLSSSVVWVSSFANNLSEELPPFVVSSYLGGFANYIISPNGEWRASPNSPVNLNVLYLGPTFRFEPIPEPSIIVLGIIGVGALFFCRRIRSH